MDKLLILIYLILISTSSLTAQSHRIKIRSSEDSIIINDPKVLKGKNIIKPDPALSYLINCNDSNDMISIIHPFYESIEIRCSLIHGDIFLTPLSRDLTETFVAASRYVLRKSDLPVSAETIKPTLIEGSNQLKLDGVMELIPGVNVVNGQANIRGGSGFSYGAGSRVMLLMDGMPMISADAGDIKWDNIPMENISSVEVIKGAGSALYGSGALNGIINVKTKIPGVKPAINIQTFQAVYSHPSHTGSYYYQGNQGFSGISLYSSVRNKFLGFLCSTNFMDDQGYRIGESSIIKRVNTKLFYFGKGKYGLNGSLGLSISNIKYGNFLFWKNSDSMYFPAPGGLNNMNNTRYILDPQFEYKINSDLYVRVNSRLYITNNKNLDNSNQNSVAQLYFFDLYAGKSWNYNKINGIITLGYTEIFQCVNADSIYGKHTGNNRGYYLQSDYTWRNFKLFTGFRMEYFRYNKEKFINKPVFRTGIVWKPLNYTWVRSSFGTGYRFPAIAEKYTSTSSAQVNVFPNSGLIPETGNSLEIGVRQGVKFKKWNGFLDIAIFDTRFSNMIDFSFGYYPPGVGAFNPKYFGFKPINIVNARIYGIEPVLILNRRKNLFILESNVGYTFIIPEYLGLNRDSMEKIPNGSILKYRFRHIWKSNIDLTYKKWNFGTSMRFNSHMLKVDTIFYKFIPGIKDYRDKNNNGYFLMDFRVSYMFSEMHKLSLVIKNIFNKEYMYMVGNIGPPRSFVVQYNFNLQH